MDLYREWADRLRNFAYLTHAKYPQYKGYFDNWKLAEGKCTVKYISGVMLYKGRCVLASPDLLSWYDPDSDHICSVKPGDLKSL